MRTVRIHSDCIDHAVHTNPLRQVFDCREGIFSFEVHDLSALAPRHLQAAGNCVNGNNAPGAQQLGTGNRKLPDRPATVNSNRTPGMDVSQLGSHVAGRENIGEQDGRVVTHVRSEEHTSELQSRLPLVCRLLLDKKKTTPLIASSRTPHFIHYHATTTTPLH